MPKKSQTSPENRAKVISCFTNRKSLTQEDIIWTTHLSRPTVVDILKSLIEDGIICKIGIGDSSKGRNPYLYGFTSNLYYSIGVDFDYPQLKIGIMNLSCQVLIQNTLLVPPTLTPVQIIEYMLQQINKLLQQFSCEKSQFIGICISITGLINSTSGISIYAEKISGWKNINLKEIFEGNFGITTYIKNDINLMAQLTYETHPELPEDFIYIGIRTGIGMGIIQNGEICLGFKGNAGLLGHTTIEMDGDLCNCGKRGCLESIAGEQEILSRYIKLTGNKVETDNSYETLINLSKAGDPNAQIILTKASNALALSIANIVKIFEFPTVVLDGWPLALTEPFRQIFESTLRGNLFENISYDLNIIYYQSDPTEVIRACGSSVVKHYIKKRCDFI